jgi:hypothetical protein
MLWLGFCLCLEIGLGLGLGFWLLKIRVRAGVWFTIGSGFLRFIILLGLGKSLGLVLGSCSWLGLRLVLGLHFLILGLVFLRVSA